MSFASTMIRITTHSIAFYYLICRSTPFDRSPAHPRTQTHVRAHQEDFIDMRNGATPAVTIPASRLPRNYHYSSPCTPPLNAPLNDAEALQIFVYERWRSNWWHLNSPLGLFAWQMPFDPMSNPWNWDRHTVWKCASEQSHTHTHPLHSLAHYLCCRTKRFICTLSLRAFNPYLHAFLPLPFHFWPRSFLAFWSQ